MDRFKDLESIAKELQSRYNFQQYEAFMIAVKVQQNIILSSELNVISERLANQLQSSSKTIQDIANETSGEGGAH